MAGEKQKLGEMKSLQKFKVRGIVPSRAGPLWPQEPPSRFISIPLNSPGSELEPGWEPSTAQQQIFNDYL